MSQIVNRLRLAFSLFMRPANYVVYQASIYQHHQLSFSQEGEDICLLELLHGKSPGFFVDVGAHHPQRFSNTYTLYLRGWRGLNIDPLPGSAEQFRRVRPGDISIEVGVAMERARLTYHQFDEPALNTFSPKLAAQRESEVGVRSCGTREIDTVPLVELLNTYLPKEKRFDVLNVDVEGLDLEVLQSNDWRIYRPRFVLVEDLGSVLRRNPRDSSVVSFMNQRDYELIAVGRRTLFFQSKDR